MIDFVIDLQDNKSKRITRFWEKIVGGEHAYTALRQDYQEILTQVHRDLGFQYIRFHGVFNDDMGICWEDKGKAKYNWQMVDKIYDFFLSIGMKPFVELSFMPKPLASGDETVCLYQGNITPPKNYKDWAKLVKNFIIHLKERYGLSEVRKWYFEVWNEPNLKCFWKGTEEDYYKLYDYTAKTIKEVDEKLRVGGPATACIDWIDKFINHCLERKSPFDFISTHIYPFGGDINYVKEKGIVQDFTKLDFVKTCVEKISLQARSCGKELHFTEWNTTGRGYQEERNDNEHAAAFLCKTIKEVYGLVDSLSYWLFSDIFEEIDFARFPFYGICGLTTIHGLKKPAYNAYQMLRMFGNKSLSVEKKDKNDNIDCWATIKNNSYQILLWNAGSFQEKGKKNISVELRNIPPGKYLLTHYRIDKEHSNVYTVWESMGSPAYPATKEIERLRQKMELEVIESKSMSLGKTLKLKTSLSANSVSLYELRLEKCCSLIQTTNGSNQTGNW